MHDPLKAGVTLRKHLAIGSNRLPAHSQAPEHQNDK